MARALYLMTVELSHRVLDLVYFAGEMPARSLRNAFCALDPRQTRFPASLGSPDSGTNRDSAISGNRLEQDMS